MKYTQNLNLNKQILLFTIPIVVILYAASGFAVYQLSKKRVLVTVQREMEVYLNKMSETIQLVEGQTGQGFSNADYLLLKPFFNQNGYYKTDYPFIYDNKGQYIIHAFKEGQRIPSALLQDIKKSHGKEGFISYTDYKDGQQLDMFLSYKYIDNYAAYLGISVNKREVLENLSQNKFVLIFAVIFATFVFLVTITLILKPVILLLKQITESIQKLSKGENPDKVDFIQSNELGQITESINNLIDNLKQKADFANEIGKNNLEAEFNALGEQDVLGSSILNMRQSLKTAKLEESKRKSEDELRNWSTAGLAMFGDILRQNNDNLAKLADNVIQNLVNYLNANQGGLFIYNDDDPEFKHLELLSAFAYNRKKFFEKRIALGEGLVGTCAVEKETIHLKEIPTEYIRITSGLGEAVPTSLLIVPLKLEDDIFGAIEIASFNEFKDYEIDFVEKIGVSISSTLSSVKNNIRTNMLLEQSQQQREEMAAQEEEMRQNMEEMQATQEEMARKSLEMEGMSASINEALLYCELNEDGSIISPNNNLLSLMGSAKQEIEGESLTKFIHTDEKDMFKNIWAEVMSGSTNKSTMHWVDKNANELYILASISPAFDEFGSIFKIYFLGQDVTESKLLEIRAHKQAEEIEQSLLEVQVEQELNAQREDEMKALLLALDHTCLITELDPAGVITYINNKNTEVLGGLKEEIEGQVISDLDFIAKTKPKEFKKFWDNLTKGVKQHREFTLKIDGKEVTISEVYTPIINEHKQVTKIINIGFDISEIKKKEKEMSALIAELETLRMKK